MRTEYKQYLDYPPEELYDAALTYRDDGKLVRVALTGRDGKRFTTPPRKWAWYLQRGYFEKPVEGQQLPPFRSTPLVGFMKLALRLLNW